MNKHIKVLYAGKELRKELGLSLDEMATETGLSKSYLSQLERGEIIAPTVGTAMKIASVLGCTVTDIFFADCV